jgi:type I restriction enzyme S subunit
VTNTGQCELRRLKYAATINDEALSEETDPDFELQYVDISNVDSSGRIHQIATYRFGTAPSRARRKVRDGDVIISTVRTYLQAIAPIENPAENLIVSTGFAVVRPLLQKLQPQFCKYALREPRFLAEVEKRSVGVSYPAINASDLGNIQVPLPNFEDQQGIAKYLDRETGRLDAMMTAKERWLELLTEKRHALITDAVTRGLNRSAPLRDSGIPWLGKIPKHWQTERTKWLFKERDERTENDDGEMLTVSHITGVTLRSEKDVNMFEAETTEGYKICRKGDLAINTLWAWMGAMGISPCDGIVSPAYNVYVPGPALKASYVEAVVRTPLFAQEIIRYSKGVWSSRLRLYPEGFFEAQFPVPPLDEQLAIAAHISAETEKIDGLREATERTIALLKERRAALIAAAVTGRLKVT